MKYTLVLLIFCAACTFRKEAATQTSPTEVGKLLKISHSTPNPKAKSPAEKELQKVLHWFEQMDAIYRESLWVIRKEKAPQGKSMFGKMHRALLTDLKQKLSNKSLFKCDVYSMKRDVAGLTGVPQNADVFHRCNSKESFVRIGDWSHPKANELTMNFHSGNLSEVLGFATGILNPRIQCKLKSSESGIVESFSCENLMVDYDLAKNQVLRFSKFEYIKSASSILHIKAEVLENLDPIRKIVVDVPMEGKIKVTETVLQAPEYIAKQVPAPTSVPAQSPKPATAPLDRTFNNPESPHEQNPQDQQTRQHPEEGYQDGFNNEASDQEGFPQEDHYSEPPSPPVPEIPRELNTR